MEDPNKPPAQGNTDPGAAGQDPQKNPPAGQDPNKAQAGAGTADPNAQKPGDGDGKPKDDKAKQDGVPEKYSDFKVPEGMNINPDLLTKFQEIAKASNLSQDKAQGLVDMAASLVAKAQAGQMEAWQQVRDKWVKDIQEDKEFGGQKFPETIARAKRCLSKFGSPEIIEFLKSTGYGDNPDLIKMFSRIDKAMGEDVSIDGSPSRENLSAAQVLYGK